MRCTNQISGDATVVGRSRSPLLRLLLRSDFPETRRKTRASAAERARVSLSNNAAGKTNAQELRHNALGAHLLTNRHQQSTNPESPSLRLILGLETTAWLMVSSCERNKVGKEVRGNGASFTSSQQPVNSPECRVIPQKPQKWKTLENKAVPPIKAAVSLIAASPSLQ